MMNLDEGVKVVQIAKVRDSVSDNGPETEEESVAIDESIDESIDAGIEETGE
jgi:hypothetical protein